MTDDSDFIRRWSRRKRAARQSEKTADAAPADDSATELEGEDVSAAPDVTDSNDSSQKGRDDDPEVLDLPDIDGLSSDSDFKPFLQKGVPKELRNRAMRKLWRVNPAFGHLDGLNDYDGDFTDAATVVKGLKTLYKVGRGFMPERKPEIDGNEPPAEEPPVNAATDATDEAIDDREEPDPDVEPDPEQKSNKIT